ncbi:MAG: DivIVA domain-containing protein [Nocardioides sp.]
MMWFFAVLIVLAMGGVAAIAAGRGDGLAPAYDDRPDALVPAAGALRGEDLRSVRFSLAFRGYRMGEVDALLDRLATQLESDGTPADREGMPAATQAGELSEGSGVADPSSDTANRTTTES